MPDPLRVVQILAPAPFGGLEAVVAALSAGLAERGHQVTVLPLLDAKGELPSCFEPLARSGVRLRPIRFPPRSYRAEISAIAEELGPGDMAHTHGYHGDLVGWRAARRSGRPVVSTVHGFTGGGWRNRFYEWAQVRALTRFDRVVAVSGKLGDDLVARGVPAGHITVIPNAMRPSGERLDRVRARARLGLPAGAWIAGWVGRLSREKGPDLFLEALAQSADWLGSVIGTGPMESGLRNQARTTGLDERVRWHGIVPGAAAFLPAFDAVVLSSRTEGTPVVLLEAMAARVPVIATAVGGIPDVIGGGEGLLVPPEDPAALARALQQVAADPEAARQRATAAGRRLETAFSEQTWLDRYESLYHQVQP